jgi:hypothetical protein
MTWIEAARGPFERLLDAEVESGREAVRKRLEGLRIAYLDLRAGGTDRPLAEGVDAARTKGPWVLWMLRKALSPPAFRPVLEAWQRGGAAETAALREMAEAIAKSDFGPFFDFWVYGDRLPEYRLRKAEARSVVDGFSVTVQVENAGTGAYPVPLVLETEEGARHVLGVTAAPGERADAQVALVTKPTRAAVDPESDVLMSSGDRSWRSVRLRKFWLF